MYVIMLSCGLDLLDRPTTPSLEPRRKSRLKRCRFLRANSVRMRKSPNNIIKMFPKISRILVTESFAGSPELRAGGLLASTEQTNNQTRRETKELPRKIQGQRHSHILIILYLFI